MRYLAGCRTLTLIPSPGTHLEPRPRLRLRLGLDAPLREIAPLSCAISTSGARANPFSSTPRLSFVDRIPFFSSFRPFLSRSSAIDGLLLVFTSTRSFTSSISISAETPPTRARGSPISTTRLDSYHPETDFHLSAHPHREYHYSTDCILIDSHRYRTNVHQLAPCWTALGASLFPRAAPSLLFASPVLRRPLKTATTQTKRHTTASQTFKSTGPLLKFRTFLLKRNSSTCLVRTRLLHPRPAPPGTFQPRIS